MAFTNNFGQYLVPESGDKRVEGLLTARRQYELQSLMDYKRDFTWVY